MKATQFLYGIEPSELDNKIYFEALAYKYDEGAKLFKKLYLNSDRTEEEDVQMFYVAEAQKFTKKLLDERYD